MQWEPQVVQPDTNMITGHDPGELPVRVTAGEKLPRLSFAGGDQWVTLRMPDTQELQPPADATNPAGAGLPCDQSRLSPAPAGRRDTCDGQAEQGKGAG